MPSPPRTSPSAIVAAGREILARDGLAGLTMQRVAEAVGVRAPSLYKHVLSRSALIRLVAEDVVADLGRRLTNAATTGDPRQDLPALALALRQFALDDPHGFTLVFAALPEESAPDVASFAEAAGPVLAAAAELAGPADALNAARTVTAWASGFLRMELAGAFHLGDGLSEAYEFGLHALIRGLDRRAPEDPPR